jgi:polyisoprenoid-binding protein YceI
MKTKTIINKIMNSTSFLFAFTLLLHLLSCNKSDTQANRDNNKDSSSELKDTLDTKSVENKKDIQEWIVDPKASKINFTIKNFGSDVQGSLEGLNAVIYFDKKDLKNSKFSGSVNVNTINTGIKKRDKDLMEEKYFNEASYKEIIIRSNQITESGKGYMADCDITIRGKVQKQKIPFTFDESGKSGIFKSSFNLNRKDYDIGGNGPIMGDNINVKLEVKVNQK